MLKSRWVKWIRAARDTRGTEIAESAFVLPDALRGGDRDLLVRAGVSHLWHAHAGGTHGRASGRGPGLRDVRGHHSYAERH